MLCLPDEDFVNVLRQPEVHRPGWRAALRLEVAYVECMAMLLYILLYKLLYILLYRPFGRKQVLLLLRVRRRRQVREVAFGRDQADALRLRHCRTSPVRFWISPVAFELGSRSITTLPVAGASAMTCRLQISDSSTRTCRPSTVKTSIAASRERRRRSS